MKIPGSAGILACSPRQRAISTSEQARMPALPGIFGGGRLFMSKSFGYAAKSAIKPLAPFTFERREPGPQDVQIEILFCGVCHSDIHQARNEWKNTVYPIVPGHEIVGRVTKVG